MESYSPGLIEKKWQKIWEDKGLYRVVEAQIPDLMTPGVDGQDSGSRSKPKFYALVEFPYPSGAGLHVGHVRAWSAMDAYVRKKRMEGLNVLFPIGWDAFGLPAENYALKIGVHPSKTTQENIETFKKQIKALGLSFDWGREINTTDPKYYKWTQWIFLKLLEKGLAYRSEVPVNWCSFCKTNLADEEVLADGSHERCGNPTQKRNQKQWLLAITKYADRLIEDLKLVDFPDKVARQQVNWIGRKEGTTIKFKIQKSSPKVDPSLEENIKIDEVEVFTTRPDTIFGVTFLVLSPEHPLSLELVKNSPQLTQYLEKSSQNRVSQDDLLRRREKTGVDTGLVAENLANGEKVSVWVSDYVLSTAGTGAIMGVPAHDERDFEFALKFNLPIRQVVKPKDVYKSVVVTETLENGREFREQLKKDNIDFSTGLSRNNREHIRVSLKENQVSSYIQLAQRSIKDNAWVEIIGAKDILVFKNQIVDDFLRENEGHFARMKEFEPLVRKSRNIWEMLKHNLFYEELICYSGEGVLAHSDEFTGMNNLDAIPKMAEKFGKRIVTYHLHDWVFSRQHYWGEPIPVVHCEKCGVVPVPEKDLPVELPYVEKYEPSGTGESPLAAMTDWVNTKCPNCAGPARRETDTMPNWAGSNWYFLRYLDPSNDKELANRSKMDHWMPVDIYEGGYEHTTLHLLYSRFIYKFLYDIGVVPGPEPYARRRVHGVVLGPDNRKMSKSFGNVINPDEIIEKFGADSLRLYEMFMGPFAESVAWNTNGAMGVYRFLSKVWTLFTSTDFSEEAVEEKSRSPIGIGESADGSKVNILLSKLVNKVSSDLENMKFNTAISTFMEFTNELIAHSSQLTTGQWDIFLRVLAPFAPHLAEELWQRLKLVERGKGKMENDLTLNFQLSTPNSVHNQSWPEIENVDIDEDLIIVIQVDGKVRDTIKIKNLELRIKEKSEIEAVALKSEKVRKYLENKTYKTIYVPGKVINFVVSSK